MSIKGLLLFIVISACSFVQAQVDTIHYLDPYYQYWPQAENMDDREGPCWAQTNNGDITNRIMAPWWDLYELPYIENSNIYGVAVVATLHDSINPIQVGMFKNMGRTEGEIINFHTFSLIDTTSARGVMRELYFQYESNLHWGEPQNDTVVYPCYEFYFSQPPSKNQLGASMDTFAVGIHNNMTSSQHYATESYLYYPSNTQHDYYWRNQRTSDFNEDSIHFLRYDNSLGDRGGCLFSLWGGFFPIVKLRCTQPKRLRETGREMDAVTVGWDSHDDAVGWQVVIVPAGTPIENGTPIDLDTHTTSYTFSNLDPQQDYLYSVRKTCHYATSHYDTLVAGEWHAPQHLSLRNVGVSTAGDASFSLSPNPTSHTATLSLASPAVAGSLLEVIDPAGRLCYSILPAAGSTTISVDMRALPTGLYTLRFSTPAGSCIRKLMRQ